VQEAEREEEEEEVRSGAEREPAAIRPAMAVRAGFLLAATAWVWLSAVSASAFDDVPTAAFDERFSSLFGDGNLVRSSDDRSVRLLLDRRSGTLRRLHLLPPTLSRPLFLSPLLAHESPWPHAPVPAVHTVSETTCPLLFVLRRFRVHVLGLLPPRLLQRLHQAAQGLHGRRRRRLLRKYSPIHAAEISIPSRNIPAQSKVFY